MPVVGRVWLGLLLCGPAHAERLYRVDGTAADANRVQTQVRAHQAALCSGAVPTADVDIDGEVHRVLAAGVLIFAKKGGLSFWGHAALRFLSCVDGRLEDSQYEYFRVGRRTLRLFPDLFEDLQPAPDPAHLDRQRGRLVMRRGIPAADRGFIGQQLARNREIYALWLDLDANALRQMYLANVRVYRDQAAQLLSGIDLPEPYQILGNNCTHHLQRDLPPVLPPSVAERVAGRVMPLAILRKLGDVPVALAVVHPGPHALRRLAARAGGVAALRARWRSGGGHLEVRRFRPVIRHGRVPAQLDAFHREEMGRSATPAIVEYLLATGSEER